MSINQFVPLPPDVLSSGQKFDTINLLGAIARFTMSSSFPGNTLERDLETRFSGLQAIGLSDATAWFSEQRIKIATLASQIAPTDSEAAESLHLALQQGNDAQSLQLLAVNDASKLVELVDGSDGSVSSRPLWSKPDQCLLLRFGYNTEQGFAYYAASLPGDSRRAIQITWQSVVESGIMEAVAILPPPKPVDIERAAASLHIMNQALVTAASAHADVMDALGQSAPVVAAPAQAV